LKVLRPIIPPIFSAVMLYLSFYLEEGFLLAHFSLIPLWVSMTKSVGRGQALASLWICASVFAALYFFWLRVFSVFAPIGLVVD